MGGIRLSIAPVLRSPEGGGRPRLLAGGPLCFSELRIGPPGKEETLPVEAAEAIWPQARGAILALERPCPALFRLGPLVAGHDAPRPDEEDKALCVLRAPGGDAAARAAMLTEAAEARRLRGDGAQILVFDPGPALEPDGHALAALPRLLHLGGAVLADLRGAPPGALGAAAAMCLDRGAMLLLADAPAEAAAARDLWLRWRAPVRLRESVA